MTHEEEMKIIKAAQAGDEVATTMLIEKYMGLITSVNARCGYTEDGIQEGIIGLLQAIRKYDCNKGASLSTYAFHWIRQRIRRQREKDVYRMPYHAIEKINRHELERNYEVEMKEEYMDVPVEDPDIVLKVFVDDMIEKTCQDEECKLLKSYFYENKTYREMAKMMGVSRQCVQDRLCKVLKKLRKYIHENYNYH